MKYTIAVYSDENLIHQIDAKGEFEDGGDASYYRDHDMFLAYAFTKIIPMENSIANADESYSEPAQDVNYNQAEENGWTHTDEGWIYDR